MAETPTLIGDAVNALDTVTTVLASVGIDITPFAGQGILLLLLLALLYVARGKLLPLSSASSLGFVPLIVAASIVFSWSYQIAVPLPDHVFGRVVTEDASNLTVQLRDFQGHTIPPGSAPVDSSSGAFAVRFMPSFGDHPRKIVVFRDGCKPVEVPISRPQIVAQSRTDIHYACKEAGS